MTHARKRTRGPGLYQDGDRLTDVFDTPAGPRRFVGTVTEISPPTFLVTWDDNAGQARYTINCEPSTLRPVMDGDEPPRYRVAMAGELGKLLADHPGWPWEVRSVLDARRRRLVGAR